MSRCLASEKCKMLVMTLFYRTLLPITIYCSEFKLGSKILEKKTKKLKYVLCLRLSMSRFLLFSSPTGKYGKNFSVNKSHLSPVNRGAVVSKLVAALAY